MGYPADVKVQEAIARTCSTKKYHLFLRLDEIKQKKQQEFLKLESTQAYLLRIYSGTLYPVLSTSAKVRSACHGERETRAWEHRRQGTCLLSLKADTYRAHTPTAVALLQWHLPRSLRKSRDYQIGLYSLFSPLVSRITKRTHKTRADSSWSTHNPLPYFYPPAFIRPLKLLYIYIYALSGDLSIVNEGSIGSLVYRPWSPHTHTYFISVNLL